MCPGARNDVSTRDGPEDLKRAAYRDTYALEDGGRVVIDRVDARAVLAREDRDADGEPPEQVGGAQERGDGRYEPRPGPVPVSRERAAYVIELFADIFGIFWEAAYVREVTQRLVVAVTRGNCTTWRETSVSSISHGWLEVQRTPSWGLCDEERPDA